MTNLRNLLLTSVALAILPGTAARAGSLSVTLDEITLSASPGQTVIVSGTVANLENVTVDLNACAVNLPGQFTNDSCAIFFDLSLGAPLSLNAFGSFGDSAHFDIFTYTVNDPYTGSFGLQPPGAIVTILGGLEGIDGYDPSVLNSLVEAPFQLTVTPEPGAAALFALAISVAVAFKRRRATAHAE
jgi:hypothetical protein